MEEGLNGTVGDVGWSGRPADGCERCTRTLLFKALGVLSKNATTPLRRSVNTSAFWATGHDEAGATMDTKLAMAGRTALRTYSHIFFVNVPAEK